MLSFITFLYAALCLGPFPVPGPHFHYGLYLAELVSSTCQSYTGLSLLRYIPWFWSPLSGAKVIITWEFCSTIDSGSSLFPFLSEMLPMFHHFWTKRLPFSGNLGNPQHPYSNPHDLTVERDYFNPTLARSDLQCLYFPEFVIASVLLFWSLLVSWLSLRV